MVRVGAEEAPLSAAVKAVWTEAMIGRYEALGPDAWALAYKEAEARVADCRLYMGSLAAQLAASRGAGGGGAAGGEGEGEVSCGWMGGWVGGC